MVTVKAPTSSQQARVQKQPTATSRSYLKLAMYFVVVAALAIYLNFTLLRSSNNDAPITYNDVPEEWWCSMKKWDMQAYLECDEIMEYPIHTYEDWVSLRNTYRHIVGKEHSSLNPNDNVDGFGNVAIVSKISHEKGRGVFAIENIKKGTRVWTSKHQSARFYDGHSFRQFLAAIPKAMACDVIMWAYVHDIADDDDEVELVISCDLDEGSFINSGGVGWDDEANIGCIDDLDDDFANENLADWLESGCPENLFALRDIEAGEEILCTYADFAIRKGWKKWGLE